SEAARGAYAAVSETLRGYDALIDQLAQITKDSADARSKVGTTGVAMTGSAEKLVTALRAAPSQAEQDAADAIERAILIVRLASSRFIITLDKADAQAFKTVL